MVDLKPRRAGQRGFTIVELLVVIFIIFALAVLTIPTIVEIIYKSKMQSTNRLGSALAQNARFRAIKRNTQAGVHLDSTTDIVTAFLDTDGDGEFSVADEVINTYQFPRYIEYKTPAGPIFDGMNDDGGNQYWVFFNPDGSLDTVGAYRYGDARGNFFELRFGPAATGKVEVRKYQAGLTNYDGSEWWGPAEGVPWEWF